MDMTEEETLASELQEFSDAWDEGEIEDERDRLKEEVERLWEDCKGPREYRAASLAVHDRAQAELDRYNEKCPLTTRDEKVQTSATESSPIAEALEGKARSTALKIIGGLLIEGYRMDIHASRLQGISEVVGDLNRAGVSIEPKTLSKYIKEAANLIEPKKKNPKTGREAL